MSNVVQIYDHTSMIAALRARNARNAIGRALGRAYPAYPWRVQVSDDGTVAQIVCPYITQAYGMAIHIHQINEELERKAVRMAGELLERFNVSRTRPDFSGLRRRINGEAIGAKQGGV